MSNIVLDTNILSDFIAQYYENTIYSDGFFEVKDTLSNELVKRFNIILQDYRVNGTLEKGVVISSSLAFIEISRKFDVISRNRYSLEQFRAFINDSPYWFNISPINNDLFKDLAGLPSSVRIKGGNVTLEWADVIHVATALSQGEDCCLATTDSRLIEIEQIKGNII